MHIYDFFKDHDNGALYPVGEELCPDRDDPVCRSNNSVAKFISTYPPFFRYRESISGSYDSLHNDDVDYLSSILYMKIRAKPVATFFARLEILADCVDAKICKKDAVPETLMEDAACLWGIYEPGIRAYRAKHNADRHLIHTETLFSTHEPQDETALHTCHVWGKKFLKELTGRDFSNDAQDGN